MYRRLETEPVTPKGEEPAPEEICVCACKSEQASDEEPQPEANQAGTDFAVDYAING